MKKWVTDLKKLEDYGFDYVIVTLIDTKGSAPQDIGARAFVGATGLLAGTVGGGKVEMKALEVAQEMLKTGMTNQCVHWNLKTDIGMTCGGIVSFFFELIHHQPPWSIAIFGAGHVAQEVVRLLINLQCEVRCIDPRPDWLAKLPQHSRLKVIQAEDMKSVLHELPEKTYVASLTMGHAFDRPILIEAFKHFQFPYVGAIGSHSKSLVLKNDLKEAGISAERIAELHCPIGEDFGNNDPAEIAISIVAQLLRQRTAELKASTTR